MKAPTHSPDGRYIIVEGKAGPRLWRATRPDLDAGAHAKLVAKLMNARRALRTATGPARAEARAAVDAAKRGLGERGPPWWADGAPDENRRLVRNSSYAQWWASRPVKSR